VEDIEPAAVKADAPEAAPGSRGGSSIAGGEQTGAETSAQAVAAPAAEITKRERAEAAKTPVEEIPAGEEETDIGEGRMKVSPLARRVAREQGVDLNRVKGSGPGGRIIRSDVEAAARAPQAPVAQPVPVRNLPPRLNQPLRQPNSSQSLYLHPSGVELAWSSLMRRSRSTGCARPLAGAW
jgi:pyruvate dehydrogenase E2 component (dihydrolipoamide acetyltransferase)